jgi:hypothetical protein
MAATATGVLTSGQVARAIGVPEWQVSALFRRHLLPEPGRLGRLRIFSEADLYQVRAALVAGGYLRPADDGRPEEPKP